MPISMPELKKTLLRTLCASLALCAGTAQAQAQAWPAKPIRWIVPFSAGGPADVIARIVSPKLGERLGQPIIIDNRVGGNSNIGHEAAARSAPDGYTMLYVVPNIVTNPSLFKTMVDPLKELAPLAQMTVQSYALVANPGFAPKTVAEIIAAAKAKPGGVTCASGGGLMTFGCEWLRTMTKTGVPLPDVPVIAETLPGFILVGWHGVMLPPGVPRPIVERLNQALGEALADKDVTKRVTDGYSEIAHTSPEAFGEILREDFAKYAKIVRDAGIKPE